MALTDVWSEYERWSEAPIIRVALVTMILFIVLLFPVWLVVRTWQWVRG